MVDNVVVGIYLPLILALGLWAGRRPDSLEEYAVVGRSYGSLVIFATMSACFIGGGFSTGNAAKVYLFGVASIVGLWGSASRRSWWLGMSPRRWTGFRKPFRSATSWRQPMARPGASSPVWPRCSCAPASSARQVGAVSIVFNVFYGIDRIWGGGRSHCRDPMGQRLDQPEHIAGLVVGVLANLMVFSLMPAQRAVAVEAEAAEGSAG